MAIFCFAERQRFEGNGQLFIIKLLTDHYFIIFLMTPIFIQCVSQVVNEARMVELIRVRRYYYLTLAKWSATILFTMVFVASVCAVTALMSIGLSFNNEWTGTIDEELAAYLIATFQSPFEAILSTSCFMLVGYSFVGCTFITASHFFSRKGAYIFIVASYVLMILAFKIVWIDWLKYISMSRFIILHHNFTWKFTWQETLLIVMIGIVVQFILIKKWRYKGKLLQIGEQVVGKGLFRYYARILFARQQMIIWFVGLLVLIVMKASRYEETLQDFIVRFFYGYMNGEVHLFTWLEQLIYVGIPIYLFAVFMQGWFVKRDWPLYMRVRSKRHWIQAVVSLMGLYVMSYVLLTLLLIISVSVLLDKPFVIDGGQLAYIFGMKVLEIGALMGLMLLLFIMTNNVTLAFLCILGLFILNFFPFAWTNYNVAGIGQLARMVEMNQSMLVSGFSYLASVFIVISCFYKKYFAGR
ncbi:hypothetical protein [Bacillus sp. OK048]|uniref:hypothetical protein n=1 Tax=Bacillus sp. OK048 TaxID=1882761 RepID=UPI001C31C792|nr:hypothetical protein [Bacillus sp. OK048]